MWEINPLRHPVIFQREFLSYWLMVTEEKRGVQNMGVRDSGTEGGIVMCSVTLRVQLKVRVMTPYKVVVGN